MKFKLFLGFLTILLLACATACRAQTIFVQTRGDMDKNIDSGVMAVDVMPGDTVAELPFTVRATDEHYSFLGMVNVNGVAMSVISPDGTVVVPSDDIRIKFFPGAFYHPMGGTQDSSLPGGSFVIDQKAPIVPNVIGVWKLRFTFPAVPQPTKVGALYWVDSAYRIGLWTDLPSSNPTNEVGKVAAGSTGKIWVFGTQGREPVSLRALPPDGAMRVENGPIVVNSSPQVKIRPWADIPVPVPMKDDGAGPDGKAGDGLYAGSYRFNTPGAYTIEASVTMQTPNGPVTRTTQREVTVTGPSSTAGTQATP